MLFVTIGMVLISFGLFRRLLLIKTKSHLTGISLEYVAQYYLSADSYDFKVCDPMHGYFQRFNAVIIVSLLWLPDPDQSQRTNKEGLIFVPRLAIGSIRTSGGYQTLLCCIIRNMRKPAIDYYTLSLGIWSQ